MNEVPTMISTKDLAYVTDIFGWSLVASKKAYHYKDEVSDSKISTLLEKIAIMHSTHCQKLADIIK